MQDVRSARLLLISLGQLNSLLLKQLARTDSIGEIIVATRDPTQATSALNLARMSAGAEGYYPIIRAVAFDLNEALPAADTLRKLRPDVTLAAPSLQSWWVLDQLPEAASAPFRQLGFGAWLPFQLLPMARLMHAWMQSGLTTPIIGAPFPDVVNPILATQQLAPTCGVGNVDELVPKVRWAVGEQAAVTPSQVRVWLVAHHALERYVYSSYGDEVEDDPPPFILHVDIAGHRLDSAYDFGATLFAPYPLLGGLDFHFLTVGSAVRLIKAFLNEREPTQLHVPGPAGLPGGYPVVIRDGDVSLDLPPGCSRAEAVAVNRASHRWDGIEAIEEDGTVVFTDAVHAALLDTLGYNWPRLPFDAVADAADELRRRFDEHTKH